MKTLTSRKIESDLTEISQESASKSRYSKELLDLANKYCPHSYIFDSQSDRYECGKQVLLHRFGLAASKQRTKKEAKKKKKKKNEVGMKELERLLDEMLKAQLIDERDIRNAFRIVRGNPESSSSKDLSDLFLAQISLDSVDPSSKLGERIVSFATSSSNASLVASSILRLQSPLPTTLVSDKIFELINRIHDVTIALPTPLETIAWDKASSTLCKFVATAKSEEKLKKTNKKDEDKEKREWDIALENERRANERACVVEAIMNVQLARRQKNERHVRKRFERFASAKRREGLKGRKFMTFRFDPSVKGDCTKPNLYELKLDGRVVKKSQQGGTIYNIQSSPATKSNFVRFALLVESTERSDEYNTIGFKDETSGHLRVKGVSMRLDNGTLYVDNAVVKNQKCRPVKKGDVIIVTLREKNKVTFEVRGVDEKDDSSVAECVWSSRTGSVRPTVAVRACGWQFRFVSPGAEKDEDEEEEENVEKIVETNSTMILEEKEEAVITTSDVSTSSKDDIQRLRHRFFVRIFIERMRYVVLKKNKELDVVPRLLEILRCDEKLAAAALRIVLLSLTEIEDHRNVIMERVLSNEVTDTILNVLSSKYTKNNKPLVNASVDLLTFVARHLVCSTSTFRESADTRNWLSTRLLAGGTSLDDEMKDSWLAGLANQNTEEDIARADKLDRIVKSGCSKRDLRERKKIESFLQKKPQCRSIVMSVRAVLLHTMGTAEEARSLLLPSSLPSKSSSVTSVSKALISSWIGPSKLLKWLGKKLQFVGTHGFDNEVVDDPKIKTQVTERRNAFLRVLNERALHLLDVVPTWSLLKPGLRRQISHSMQKGNVDDEEDEDEDDMQDKKIEPAPLLHKDSSSFDVKRTRFFVRLWRQIGNKNNENERMASKGYRETVRSSISTAIRAFVQSDVSVPQLKQALEHRHEVARRRSRGLHLFVRLLGISKDSTLLMRVASSLNKCRFRAENGLRNGYDEGLSGTGASVAVTIARATRHVEDAVYECFEVMSEDTNETVRARLALLSWCASSVMDDPPHVLSRRLRHHAKILEKLRLQTREEKMSSSTYQKENGKICLVKEEISEPILGVETEPIGLEYQGFTIVSRIYHTSTHCGTILNKSVKGDRRVYALLSSTKRLRFVCGENLCFGKSLEANVSVELKKDRWYHVAVVVRPWSRSVRFYLDGHLVENAKTLNDLDFFEDCSAKHGSRIAIGRRIRSSDIKEENEVKMPILSRDASVEVGTFMALATNEEEEEEEEDEEEKSRREKEIEEQRRRDETFEGKIADLFVYSRTLSEKRIADLAVVTSTTTKTEEKTTDENFKTPICKKNHPLVLGANVGKYSGKKFYCDVCGSSGDLPEGYSCVACKYDLCVSCYRKEEAKSRRLDPRFLMLEARRVLSDAVWTLQRVLALEVFSCNIASKVPSALATSLLTPMKSHLSMLLKRNDLVASAYALEAISVLLEVTRCSVAKRELRSKEWCGLLLKHSICFHREEVIIQKLCLRVLRLSNVVFSEQDLRRIRSLVMPLYLEKTTHDFVIPHEAVRLLHAVSGKMLDLSCIARQLEKVHDELIDLATTAMTSQNQDTNIYVFGNISGMTESLESSALECFATLAVISKHWKCTESIEMVASSLIQMLLVSLQILSTKKQGPALCLALRLRVAAMETAASILENNSDVADAIMRTKVGRAVVASLAECSLSCPVPVSLKFDDKKSFGEILSKRPWSLKRVQPEDLEINLARTVCETLKLKNTNLALRSIRETRTESNFKHVVEQSVKWLQDLTSEETRLLGKLQVGFVGWSKKDQDQEEGEAQESTKVNKKTCWDTRRLSWYRVSSAWSFPARTIDKVDDSVKNDSTYMFEYNKRRDAFDVKRRKKSGIPKVVTIGSMITICGDQKTSFVMIPGKKNKKRKKRSSKMCDFVRLADGRGWLALNDLEGRSLLTLERVWDPSSPDHSRSVDDDAPCTRVGRPKHAVSRVDDAIQLHAMSGDCSSLKYHREWSLARSGGTYLDLSSRSRGGSGAVEKVMLRSKSELKWCQRLTQVDSIGWGYSGRHADAIGVRCSVPVTVYGIAAYGGQRGTYEASLSMYKDLKDSRHIQNAVPVGETSLKTTYEAPDKEPSPIYFDTPVKMDPNVDYMIVLKILSRNKNSHSGSGGKTNVNEPDGTTFTFFTVQGGNNGTCNVRGQIPVVIYASGHHHRGLSSNNSTSNEIDLENVESHIHNSRKINDNGDVRRKLCNVRVASLQRRWFVAVRATMWRLMAYTEPPKLLQDPHNIRRLLSLTYRSDRAVMDGTPTLERAVTDLRVSDSTLYRVAELATTALLGTTIANYCSDAFVWCLEQSSKPLSYSNEVSWMVASKSNVSETPVALRVNFCHPRTSTGSVANYADDRGLAIKSKLIGSFGWRGDHSEQGVDRRHQDQEEHLKKTPAQVKSPKLLTFANLIGGQEGDQSRSEWSAQLMPGRYRVRITCGDPCAGFRARLRLNGERAGPLLGNDTYVPANMYASQWYEVGLPDGRLRIDQWSTSSAKENRVPLSSIYVEGPLTLSNHFLWSPSETTLFEESSLSLQQNEENIDNIVAASWRESDEESALNILEPLSSRVHLDNRALRVLCHLARISKGEKRMQIVSILIDSIRRSKSGKKNDVLDALMSWLPKLIEESQEREQKSLNRGGVYSKSLQKMLRLHTVALLAYERENNATHEIVWFECEKEEKEEEGEEEAKEDEEKNDEMSWYLWEVVWPGHVRVRDSPRLSASVVDTKEFGTLVRGSSVVPGEDRKDSKWLKLADGSGYMLIVSEEDEDEDVDGEEEEEEKKEDEEKTTTTTTLLLGPLPESQSSWERLRLQPSFVSQRTDEEEQNIQDAQMVMAFTGRDLEICLIALKEGWRTYRGPPEERDAMGRIQVAADWLYQVDDSHLRQARDRVAEKVVEWTLPKTRIEAGRSFRVGFEIKSKDKVWKEGEWIGLYRKDESDANLETDRPERCYGISKKLRQLGRLQWADWRGPFVPGTYELRYFSGSGFQASKLGKIEFQCVSPYVNGTDLMRLHTRLVKLYENSRCRELGSVLVELIDEFVSEKKKGLGDILFLDFQQYYNLSTRLWSFLVSKAKHGEDRFRDLLDTVKSSKCLARNATSLIRTNRLISESIAAVDLSLQLDNFEVKLAEEDSDEVLVVKHYDLTQLIRLNRGLILISLKNRLMTRALNLTKTKSSTHVKMVFVRQRAFAAAATPDGTGKGTMFVQAYEHLKEYDSDVLRQGKDLGGWGCKFAGEGADDAGGPYRESLTMMCQELQNFVIDKPKRRMRIALLPLLRPTNNNLNDEGSFRDCYTLNAAARSDEQLEMIRFLGRLLGVAIRTKDYLDLCLAPEFWANIVNDRPNSLRDLATSDVFTVREIIREVLRLTRGGHGSSLENLELNFVAATSDGRDVPLKRGGESIRVNLDNAQDFVHRLLRLRLDTESRPQRLALREGLSEIVPVSLLTLYTRRQAERLVCGDADIDIDLLRENTVYGDTTSDQEDLKGDEVEVKIFWKVLSSFDCKRRADFLRFVYGRTRLPLRSDFTRPFNIRHKTSVKVKPNQDIPTAQTCFFRLYLPAFDNEESCSKMLLVAVREGLAMDADFDAEDPDAWRELENPRHDAL